MLRRSIENALGDRVLQATSEGRGTAYALRVRNIAAAQKLMNLTTLEDQTKVRITMHPFQNTVRCVVSNFATINDSEAKLKEDLKSQGVIEVKRITRNVSGVPMNTSSLIITTRGTRMPTSFHFGFENVLTRPYYQSPMLCFKCWNFGHTKKRCEVQTICGNCGRENHLAENERCLETKYCNRCKTDEHSTSSRSCPVYVKENEIQKLRTDRNYSYTEAKKEWEACKGTNSYARTTALPTEQDKIITALNSKMDKVIAALSNSVATPQMISEDARFTRLEKQIEELRIANNKKDEQIRALTEALRKKNQHQANHGYELVKKHGTVEELAALVNTLRDEIALRKAADHQQQQQNASTSTIILAGPTQPNIDESDNNESDELEISIPETEMSQQELTASSNSIDISMGNETKNTKRPHSPEEVSTMATKEAKTTPKGPGTRGRSNNRPDHTQKQHRKQK